MRFIKVCQDAIEVTPSGASLRFDGSDYVQQYNACDKPMLRAVLQWATERPPDGSEAWWLTFCRVAKAAQSKQQTLRHTLMYGLQSCPMLLWLMRSLDRALTEVEPE